MHKPLLFTLLFLLASVAELRAQACNFDHLMREGKVFLDKKKPEYRRALYKFNAARTCDPNQSAVVDKEVDRLFGMIEGERDKVVVALAETERARLRADTALLLADTEKKNAIAAKEEAEAAEKKTAAVLDKIYFYEDRFGLAYDKNTRLYGFIDQQLNTLIAFKYSKPSYFTKDGFALVVEAGTDTIVTFDPETYEEKVQYSPGPNNKGALLLIDTTGREFRVATDFDHLSPEITALDLREKGLTETPDTILKSIHLNVLLLTGNQLTSLPEQIGELKNLQSLYLSGNQLQTLPAQIGELKSLQSLDLSGNELTTLPAQIGELKSLQSLDLSWNKLDTLPTQIGELKSLQSLNLTWNLFLTLPAQIGELKSLRSLKLSGSQLQTLPAQIFELKNLQSLDLSQNQLQTLPAQIGELKSLRSLELFENQLQTLPVQIGELKNLQSLGLSFNQLQTLPVQIGELKNLQSLDLRSNKLQNLPLQIVELKNLQSLNLSDNQFQTLPSQIFELKNLPSLDLSQSQLQTLPEQIGELKNLQSLNLSRNQLQTLPTQIGELKNLQSLDLSWNQLQTLPLQIVGLKNLKSLDLRLNQLQTMPAQIGELKNLRSLNLSGNQLRALPFEVFGKMPNLKEIVLNDIFGANPLSEAAVSALRTAMPWCYIEFNPKAFLEKEKEREEAIFIKNLEARKKSETAALEGEARLKRNPTDTLFQNDLAHTYINLGWQQLLTGQFAEAEVSTIRGFGLNSTNIYLPTTRAAALLFQGKTEAALLEYEKWKDLPLGRQGMPFYREAFLSDFEAFEKAGIIPEARKADVEAVRKLLGVKK